MEKSLKHGDGKKVNKKALKQVEDWWVTGSYEDGTLGKGMGKAMVSTTQAVDIINGGLKVNALVSHLALENHECHVNLMYVQPESVVAIVNHRINLASSVAELQQQITDVITPVASKLNLAVEAFGKEIQPQGHGCHFSKDDHPKAGKVILNVAFNSSLEPAPVSPFTVDSPAWRLLSGTVKGVYATRPGAEEAEGGNDEIIMAPSISTGVSIYFTPPPNPFCLNEFLING